MKCVLIVAATMAASLAVAAAAEQIAVCVSPDAPPALKGAADDLVRYIQKATTQKAALTNAPPASGNPAILIGPSPGVGENLLPDEDLGPEAFAITRRKNQVVITGRYPVATANGVYYFIEKYLNVHWFVPGPLGESVPAESRNGFLQDVLDEQVAPDFEPRTWSAGDPHDSWKQWSARNRVPSPPQARWKNFKNYRKSILLFPPEKYAQSHPEYYPLVQGKRSIPDKGAWNWQPCYSNGEVRGIYVEDARAFFDANGEVPSYDLGLDDAEIFCECADCRKLDGDVDAFAERDFSNRYYWFLTEVARQISETHPGRQIGTLVYACTRETPTNMTSLPDNVFAYLADTESQAAQWWKDDIKKREMHETRQWAAFCTHLGRYEYYGFAAMTPRYYPHLLDQEIKFDRELGVASLYVEMYGFRSHQAPMVWAATRLYWDAAADIDELLNVFMSGMFAEAAAPMKRYWGLLEGAWINRGPEIKGTGWRDLETQARLFSLERLDQLQACLDEARASAESDVNRRRINVFAEAFEFSSYISRSYHLGQALRRAAIDDQRSARLTLDAALHADTVALQRVRRWPELRARENLTGESIRHLEKIMGGELGKLAQFEAPMYDVLDRVVAWYSRNAPAELGPLLADLRRGRPQSILIRILDAKTALEKGALTSSLANGDFEADETSARGWGTWQTAGCTGRFAISSDDGGSHFAEIVGAKSAVFMQDLPVNPGEVYYASARARHLPAGAEGTVSLTCGLMDPQGKWLDGQSTQFIAPLEPGDGRWHTIRMIVHIPERAGRLRFMCAAKGMSEEHSAQFDDVVLVLLPK